MTAKQLDFECGTGDNGMTSLAVGTRVEKTSPYIQALGATDELSALLGVVIAADVGTDMRPILADVQVDLLHVSAELSQPGVMFLSLDRLQRVDRQLMRLSAELPKVEGCLLPTGTMAAALCFKARATCRTLEREMVSLEAVDVEGSQDSLRIPYLNRLGDLLFSVARTINRRADAEVTADIPVPKHSSIQ